MFPCLYQGAGHWREATRRARDMGFNTLYLNTYHVLENSGCIYAIMDYDSYDPVTFPGLTLEDANRLVRLFLWESQKMGLRVLCDLVVNHTAMDSSLVKEHPDWYQYDESGKVQSAPAFTLEGNLVVWRDFAKPSYSDAGVVCECMCKRYLEMDSDGFRYMFNSAKGWDYAKSWFIEQNTKWKEQIGSVPIESLAYVIHAGRMLTQEQNTALVGSGTLMMLMECWLYLMHPQSQPTVYYKRDQIVRHTAFRIKCLW